MTKKIEGYSDFMNSFQEGPRPEAIYCDFIPATLVVHEGPHERVFTESEVKAMMEDVAHCITWPEAKRVLKNKHGISID
jgi:hypothetical protein